jgi:hypothetical protein
MTTDQVSMAQEKYDRSRYAPSMGRAISVRLDDEALRALRLIEATGLSRSDAIRSSIVAAADRLRRREAVVAEAAALEADEADRREMQEVAALMEALRAPG